MKTVSEGPFAAMGTATTAKSEGCPKPSQVEQIPAAQQEARRVTDPPPQAHPLLVEGQYLGFLPPSQWVQETLAPEISELCQHFYGEIKTGLEAPESSRNERVCGLCGCVGYAPATCVFRAWEDLGLTQGAVPSFEASRTLDAWGRSSLKRPQSRCLSWTQSIGTASTPSAQAFPCSTRL